MGGLIPEKIKNYKGWSKIFPEDSSFLFFYEDNKLRKCKQQNGLSKINSKADGAIIGLGASANGLAFYFTCNRENS